MWVVGAAVKVGVVLVMASWGLPVAASATGAPARATCHGRAPTVVGSADADVLRGTPGPDVIVGLGGNDILVGRGGDDLLCGGFGLDRLAGGPGDDRLWGGHDLLHVTDEGTTERVGDQLSGGSGDDLLAPGRDVRRADDVIHDALSWESAARGVHVDTASGVATGQGRDRFDSHGAWVVGSAHGDVIEGSGRPDLLSSGGGADEVRGFAGADRILVDPAGAGGGRDLAFGGPGDDTISADGGEDVLRGGPGDDVMDDLGPAADRMYGGAGADRLFTQITDVPDTDQVVDGGSGGQDFVDVHTQTINPAALASTAHWSMRTGRLVFTLDHPVTLTVSHVERVDLSAFGTAWTISGTSGPDAVFASGSAGTVFSGRDGDDVFMGSSFDDLFRGGAGSDHSLGMGVGTDTCSGVEVFDANDCENVVP